MSAYHHMAGRVPVEHLDKFNPADRNTVKAKFVYDTVVYPAIGAESLQLLSVPVGGQLNDNSRAKTEQETNLFSSGTLASNQAMLVKGVQVIFTPSVSIGHAELDGASTGATQKFRANDIEAFYNSGILHVQLKGVDVLKDGPMRFFVPDTRFDGAFALSSSDTDNNKFLECLNVVGRAYPLEWFTWRGGEVITAKLLFPNGKVAMPSGAAAAVQLRFFGDVYEVK